MLGGRLHIHWHISSIILIENSPVLTCVRLMQGGRVSRLVVGRVSRLVGISLLVLIVVLGSTGVGVELRPDLWPRLILWMRLVEALPQLSIAGYKCVLAARNPFQKIISKIFDHHLLFALHVFNDNCLDGIVWVVLQGVFVLHDTRPAFLVLHLNKNCAKDGLVGVGRLGRDLPDCLDHVPVDINTRSTDLG